MNDEKIRPEEEASEPRERAIAKRVSVKRLKQSAGWASSTFALGSLADLALIHASPTGFFLSALAGYVAWRHGPDVYSYVRGEFLPALGLASEEEDERDQEGQKAARQLESQKRGRSLLERALGIYPDQAEQDDEEDDQDDGGYDDGCLEVGEKGSLRPHADTILSKRVVILGMPGSGKGNVVSVLAEELGRFDAPLIIFDRKPEYRGLCQEPYLSNPFAAGAHTLAPEQAWAFAQRVMRERLQVVVDLASYHNDADAARVMIEMVNGVGSFQEGFSVDERIPCTFFLEEAHHWLPENEALSTIRNVKRQDGTPLFASLQQSFIQLATEGRSFGMGLVVSTQRSANVDKQLISVAEWRFLLKAMEPADLRVYRTYWREAEQAMTLQPGQAYVIGPDDSRGVYRVRRRYSPDEAKSPGLTNIRNAASVREVRRPVEQTAWGNDARMRAADQGGTRKLEYEPDNDARLHPHSPSPPASPPPVFERGNLPFSVHPREAVNAVNGLHRPVNVGEPFTGERETFTGAVNNERAGFTAEEEVQVLLAYADLLKAGEKVTRTAIRDRLGWNNKQYSRVIMPVCDKHHIA